MAETIKAPPRLSCLGGCGNSWADEDEAMASGSEFLAVARAWRCGSCTRELIHVVSTGSGTLNASLLPTSRGALPKETASTIVAPRVKA